MKICFKCGIEKDADQFYKHPAMKDGRLNKCIECTRDDVSRNYALKRNQYRAYEVGRNQAPQRKEDKLRYQADSRLRDPQKCKARSAVANAKRNGRLVEYPCWVCGAKAQAHHRDYSRPLDVEWLCQDHHRQLHAVGLELPF